jgi:hypothetical protein
MELVAASPNLNGRAVRLGEGNDPGERPRLPGDDSSEKREQHRQKSASLEQSEKAR